MRSFVHRLTSHHAARPLWFLLLIVGFAVAVIGPPLWGHGVFAGTDMLTGQAHTNYLNDTVDSALPQADLFGTGLHAGQWISWNPYIAGGVPLGALPNTGLAAPEALLPYLLLPAWLAPAYVKLLEIAIAVGGSYLYLRRIKLNASAALLGGLVFAGSGFLVVWTNWPQSRVAALIPALFWAAERVIQRRTARDGALLAVVFAAMLLGGFPAVAGYVLYTLAGYLLVRVVASYRRQLRQLVRVLVTALAGLVGGAALAAVQLVPFAVYMSHAYVADRQQTDQSRLSPLALLTTLAPWSLGTTNPDRPPAFFAFGPASSNNNLVEAMSYLGATAVVLVLVALGRYRHARAVLPPGVLPTLVVSALCWLELIYIGGWPLGQIVRLPVFDTNFVGRARSVFGFLLAVLAAIGVHLLIEQTAVSAAPARHASTEPAPGPVANRQPWWPIRPPRLAAVPGQLRTGLRRLPRPGVRALPGAVVVVAVLIGYLFARRAARTSPVVGDVSQRLANLDRQAALALALLATAGTLVWLVRRGPRVRAAALLGLPVLVVIEALLVSTPYLPRAERSTYYPRTDAVNFLGEHLGSDRMASGGGLPTGVETAYRLRSLDAHAYVDRHLADLLGALPDWSMFYNTVVAFSGDYYQVTSPVLDRLGVKYFATAPDALPFGRYQPAPAADGQRLVAAGETVQVPAGTGPLRGIGITVLGRPVRGTQVSAIARDPAGKVLARSVHQINLDDTGTPPGVPQASLYTGWVLNAPLAGEAIPANTPVTVDVTLSGGPLAMATAGGTPVALLVHAYDDGLRLAFAGSAVVYQRLHALPRIRWAGSSVVLPDKADQIAAVAAGQLPADTVVLARTPRPTTGHSTGGQPAGGQQVGGQQVGGQQVGGQPAGGQPAAVTVVGDEPDAVSVDVRAEAAGYLVVADTLQHGWSATVDGKPAEIVPAEYAVAAVAVPAGNHQVRLHYAAPLHNAGGWISLAALLSVLFIGAVPVMGYLQRQLVVPPRKGTHHVDLDAAGQSVHRTVATARVNRAARRHRSDAVLQRGGAHPDRDRADHPGA